MLAQEPALQFAGAKHVTHHQIVGAGVAQFGGTLCEFTAVDDDYLVRLHQARQLVRNLLTSYGWPRTAGPLSVVVRHRASDSDQNLTPLTDHFVVQVYIYVATN